MRFTITLNSASAADLTVNFATEDVTATAIADSDYTATSGSVTFAIGETSKNVDVSISPDNLDENNETFKLNVTSSLPAASGVGTITDDPNDTASIAINDVTATEGNSGSTAFTFSVTMTGKSSTDVGLDWATAVSSAVFPDDFANAVGSVSWAAGTTGTKNVVVQVVGDTTPEPDETFAVNLSNRTGIATVADGSGLGTITNDDAPPPTPTLSVANLTIDESAGTATVVVTSSAAAGAGGISVSATTSDGTATAPVDYAAAASAQVTIAPGQTTGNLLIPITSDSLDEPSETFTVTLAGPVNATILDGSATVTITDNNDHFSTISVGNATVTEPANGATTNIGFTVTLAQASARTVTVNYATANGTAQQPGDYLSASGTLTYTPGQTSKTVDVTINGDATAESNETLLLNLSGSTGVGGATPIADAQGVGTIIEPSAPPALSIGDVTVAEDGGSATLLVKISRPPDTNVSVNLNSADGTGKQPGDYTALTGASVSWGIGDGSDKTVTVPINNDTIDENSETFTVSLVNESPGTQVTTRTATVTITDNDNVSALAVNDVSVTEPSTGTVNAVFTVTLSQASERTVTAPYSVAPGTATPGADYTATSGTLTFTPGQTSKTVTVVVKGDTVNEPNETFTLALGTPTGAKIGDGDGQGLIVDPSAPPSLTIADGTVDEGAGTLSLVVTLSGNASAQTITVDYAAASGTATSGVDFAATSGKLSFPAGTTSLPIAIPITNDAIGEADETFSVTISNPVGATIAKSRANVRLVDNDPVPGGGGGGGGGGGTLPKPPPTTTPTPTPAPILTPPVTTTVRLLQARVLSAKLAGKVGGRQRAAIRLTLNQSVTAKVTMVQGKRKLTSTGFPVKFGNRTVYVILPAFLKAGKVQFQVSLTPVKGSVTTLKTFVTIKPPPVKKP